VAKTPPSYPEVVQVCPRCGEKNPQRARFCLSCATPLAPTPTPEEERKVVSVLFVDLVGFTERSDRDDPEDVRARLRLYHARLKQEIESRGGTVEKFVGDAVMAVFGAPVAHEDDAERAVLTALRILDAIPELNENHPGLELAVRAAVNTGEAVVVLGARSQEGEGMVAGDVVNTASRLQQIAPVGGVVVGEITHRATSHAFDYEELEPVRVKGKAEPIPVWRAIGSRTRLGVDLMQGRPTPFIGREHDLSLLKETYARTLRESSIQLVTVTGEPGVGKSRLVAEFRAIVDYQPEIVFWRQGRCLSYGQGITFWALGEVVKGQAGILESDGPEQAAEKLRSSIDAVIEETSEREWLEARLAPLVGLSPEAAGTAERSESFAAWRRFLEIIAATRPLIVVFEDLHWADAAMLEFVEYLVDWSTGTPLLVVCTARPELYERERSWGGGKRNSTTISLSPLTEEDTARLLSALFGQAVLPAETQAALLEHAGGNPLYAEEFVRMLTDRGVLTPERRLVQDGEIPVPETVQALIAARLDTLTPERKSLLHDAAVVGKVFWAGAVASLGGVEEKRVKEGLHELARKELVRPSRSSSVHGEDECSFWHLLVRDVAYQQIPRAARARKHRAAAEWIERIAEDRVADHAEILVHHYGEALDLTLAAGTTNDLRKLESKLGGFLVMAGDRAIDLDVAKADEFYRRALELLPAEDPARAAVLAKAAEAAFRGGHYPEAERACRHAIAASRARGETVNEAEATTKLGNILWYRGESAQALELSHEAIRMLEGEPPGRELAGAYGRTAFTLSVAGHPREGLELAEKALALAEELGLDDQAVIALGYRGTARHELGDVGGQDDLREALRRGLELGLGYETGVQYNNLAFQVWVGEGPTDALEISRSGIEFSERRGLIRQAMWTSAESLWMLFEAGQWDELLHRAERLIEWDRGRDGSQIGVIALTERARVLVHRSKFREAAALEDDFLPRARQIGDPQVLLPALATAALIEQARGDLPEAVRLMEELDRAAPAGKPERAVALPDALRVCAMAKAIGLGERLTEAIAETTKRAAHTIVTADAVMAEARGELERAAGRYADAAEHWGEFGFLLERGHSLLGAGRCLLGVSRSREAAEKLEGSREIFGGLRARPLIAEADALLEHVGAVSS
jgi:class 3 adenylate cyclase/tetratricopeptide (TPR) repeat protein